MELIQKIEAFLKSLGATDVQVTKVQGTEYECQHCITCIFKERAYELTMGQVRQHGGIRE